MVIYIKSRPENVVAYIKSRPENVVIIFEHPLFFYSRSILTQNIKTEIPHYAKKSSEKAAGLEECTE